MEFFLFPHFDTKTLIDLKFVRCMDACIKKQEKVPVA